MPADWTRDQQRHAQETTAAKLLTAVQGRPVAGAGGRGAWPAVPRHAARPEVTRSAASEDMPAELLANVLFGLKPGEPTMVEHAGRFCRRGAGRRSRRPNPAMRSGRLRRSCARRWAGRSARDVDDDLRRGCASGPIRASTRRIEQYRAAVADSPPLAGGAGEGATRDTHSRPPESVGEARSHERSHERHSPRFRRLPLRLRGRARHAWCGDAGWRTWRRRSPPSSSWRTASPTPSCWKAWRAARRAAATPSSAWSRT